MMEGFHQDCHLAYHSWILLLIEKEYTMGSMGQVLARSVIFSAIRLSKLTMIVTDQMAEKYFKFEHITTKIHPRAESVYVSVLNLNSLQRDRCTHAYDISRQNAQFCRNSPKINSYRPWECWLFGWTKSNSRAVNLKVRPFIQDISNVKSEKYRLNYNVW
jgi:hypothetical protein